MVLAPECAWQGFAVLILASGTVLPDIGVNHLLLIVAGAVALLGITYLIEIGKRMRGELRFRVRRTAVALSLYTVAVVVMPTQGYSLWETLAFSLLLALTPLAFMRRPYRSRTIPKHIRQAVIARDLKGEPFDPTRHHIDHIVPYVKGGDHSMENLRVITKRRNQRKGAKMPGVKELLWSRSGKRSERGELGL